MAAAALLAGTGVWEPAGLIDSDLTGGRLNHSPALVRDGAGRLTPSLPNVTTVFAHGDNNPSTWDLASATWTPDMTAKPLRRYYSAASGTHQVTTGAVAPGFSLEMTLGHVSPIPLPGTVAVYSCRVGAAGVDRFLTLSPTCEGQYPLGITGWIHSTQPVGIGARALYRCFTGVGHFVSTSSTCEGARREGLLGYARTSS